MHASVIIVRALDVAGKLMIAAKENLPVTRAAISAVLSRQRRAGEEQGHPDDVG